MKGSSRKSSNPGGLKLLAARTAAGLSQQELAERLGCDDSAITGWESQRGRRRRPHLFLAIRLQEVLGLHPAIWL